MAAVPLAQKRTRRDPAARRVDRTVAQGAIKNADPTKEYVWAYKVGDAIGYYENIGYDVVLSSDDGPRAQTARKKAVRPGEPVEWFGNVLMCIDKVERDEMVAEQQEQVDLLEARIISKGGGVDSLRGIQGLRGRDGVPVLGFENKTSGTQVELE